MAGIRVKDRLQTDREKVRREKDKGKGRNEARRSNKEYFSRVR